MSKNNSKGLIELKHKKLLNNNQGFSLLELVVTVGVVLVLSLVGLLSYNGITKNARQAAVNNTADTVYSRAMAYEADTNPDTTYQTALEEYNKTSGSLDNDNTKKSITVEGTLLESNSLRIRAFYTNDESIEAIKTTPSSSTNNSGTGENNTIITSPSEITSTETILNYRCDEDFTATFPNDTTLHGVPMGLDSEAVVKLTGTDGTNKEATGAGISHTMIAGVEYTVTINGKFHTLTGNKCLRSVESIGTDSDVKQISWLGANITEVPNQIPDSVTSMTRAFTGATSFNQDISDWDLSNVDNMNRMFEHATAFNNGGQPLDWAHGTAENTNVSWMFYGASSFNQDISDWDVSNVRGMGNMFSGASSFNNGGQPLDWGDKTSKVTSMSWMFQNATNFNQDISDWDVSNVGSMHNMFENATAFNNGGQPLDWDVSNVTNMSQMFSYTQAFNQDISGWDVSNVGSMHRMFYNATAFNNGGQPLDWGNKTAQVRDMHTMFYRASSFNQNVSGWNVGNVSQYYSFAGGSGIASKPDYIPAKFR